jgi:hypothetical protein
MVAVTALTSENTLLSAASEIDGSTYQATLQSAAGASPQRRIVLDDHIDIAGGVA